MFGRITLSDFLGLGSQRKTLYHNQISITPNCILKSLYTQISVAFNQYQRSFSAKQRTIQTVTTVHSGQPGTSGCIYSNLPKLPRRSIVSDKQVYCETMAPRYEREATAMIPQHYGCLHKTLIMTVSNRHSNGEGRCIMRSHPLTKIPRQTMMPDSSRIIISQR